MLQSDRACDEGSGWLTICRQDPGVRRHDRVRSGCSEGWRFDDALLIADDLGGFPLVFSRGREGGVRAFATRVGDEAIELVRDPATGEVTDSSGSTWDLGTGRCTAGLRRGQRLESVAVSPAFWFAWSSFFPNTQVIDRR